MDSFIDLVKAFSDARTDHNCPERILVEKPFGSNLATARELNTRLLEAFSEDQILRIDHYLGKGSGRTFCICASPISFRTGLEPPLHQQHPDFVF